MFGKQGKVAKVNVLSPIMGKKSPGAVKGAGNRAEGKIVTPIKGNKNKLK